MTCFLAIIGCGKRLAGDVRCNDTVYQGVRGGGVNKSDQIRSVARAASGFVNMAYLPLGTSSQT